MPMDVCVADTQAAIGYMLQQSLLNMTRRVGRDHPIATIVTQVEVDPADPAFQNPTKPIGPFYDPSEAKSIGGAHCWRLVPDADRGYRRVVPSPRPVKIIELPVIRRLVNAGTIVITVGGGGIPVVRKDEDYAGVDAVIDKDLASALLARNLNAYTFIILTTVDQVSLDFAKPTQRPLARITADEARAHLANGQFPAGSMGPKIEAALEFLEGNSGEVLITSLESLPKAILGETGTRLVYG
ncbi:MAG: carbamate kinase, partial [Nitrospinota bacterium]|nr:carbamate kinase [Nitrospinota bacterium]